MSNPKLTDVARLAGVSPATVSRAINQPAIVNAKTLERSNKQSSKLAMRPTPQDGIYACAGRCLAGHDLDAPSRFSLRF